MGIYLSYGKTAIAAKTNITMKQYGQSEYAEAVLNSAAEKLWKFGLLIEKQY